MEDEYQFLGRGWSFPPTFDRQIRDVVLVSEELDIKQSLQILLGTRPGERVMLPNYGCNLDIMLFEPITTTLITVTKDIIKTAILYHEPRIEVQYLNINTSQLHNGLVIIEIDYLVRSTNSRFNLVYPFYLEEGSNIRIT